MNYLIDSYHVAMEGQKAIELVYDYEYECVSKPQNIS